MNRPALVAHAQVSIAKGSRSFALASRLFDRETRERAWLLYSWCRKCDDIADGQDHGGALTQIADPAARLAIITGQTERALTGEPTGDPAFDTLALVVKECAIPHEWPRDLVRGFAMDAVGFRPADEAELLTYCYHVAGVVGLMMAVVMGVSSEDEATLEHANHLGLAFQLANIARDVREDAEGGRCYLPADWLAAEGVSFVPGADFVPDNRKALARITARLSARASEYEASARVGATRLPFRSRWAVLAAAGIYGDIARDVARRGDAAWDERVVTSGLAKAGWVARAFAQAL